MDNPLTILNTDGNSNEFPVLKAFQEYIDAEQAKARKRMLGLSVFFIVLLSVVVVTFVLILTTVLNRNQSLSDRLLDYALREREKTVAVQQIPATSAASQPEPSADIFKTFIERLEKEQSEMKAAFEKQLKENEKNAADLKRARDEELKRVQAELAAERERNRKEAQKKAEIERHRRNLYPDYYRMEKSADDLPIPPPASTFKRKIRPVETPSSSVTVEEKHQNPVPVKKKTASPLSAMKPVTYFNVDDDESVPFLLETPKQNK